VLSAAHGLPGVRLSCYERSAILLASAHVGGSTSIQSPKKLSPSIVERKGFRFYFVFPFYLSPCGEALQL